MHGHLNFIPPARTKFRARLLLLCSGLLFIATALAAAPPVVSPERIEGAKLVDAEETIELATSLAGLVIIDSRIGNNRTHGFIEGSHSLADVDTDCASLAELLPTLDTPVLFYCNGPRCGRSATAVETALACGYSTVYWFRGGFDEWKAKGYPLLRD